MDAIDEAAVRTIRGLTGVHRVEFLEPADCEALRARRTAEAAENRGVEEVLSRPRILCLFKDVGFRPPPEPTLLLVDDAGTVLGRELVPGDRPPADRRVAHLGKDFVLYAGARPRGAYHFLLPAVRFPELETIPRLVRVVSASPDTPQDEYLRSRFGVPLGREFASILVGYAVRNP
ncbi:MAG TPA: hypothetical protein HA326_06845 [Thermoplasmata archaeon]|nr:hypothetical protein [Thermoplasmata archaeon]